MEMEPISLIGMYYAFKSKDATYSFGRIVNVINKKLILVEFIFENTREDSPKVYNIIDIDYFYTKMHFFTQLDHAKKFASYAEKYKVVNKLKFFDRLVYYIMNKV